MSAPSLLDALLENFWILRRTQRELYFEIKDGLPALKPFLEEKLGCPAIVYPDFIRLQKLPGVPESWMGIREFSDPQEYALLLTVLMFLEDKGPGEQFVLSQLTEYVESAWPGGEPLDWTLFRLRRQMVNVLKYAASMQLMLVDDGDTAQFADERGTEVLYEATGLSRYFVRSFPGHITDCHSLDDILDLEWIGQDADRGLVRRQRVYRRLLFSPAVQAEAEDDPDLLYIRNQRNVLHRDIEQQLGAASLQVHRNLALVRLDPEKSAYRDVFPGTGQGRAIIDVLLQVCSLLREAVDSGRHQPDPLDRVRLAAWEASSLIETARRRHAMSWSGEYRKLPPAKLVAEVLDALEDFRLIQRLPEENAVVFLPLAGRFQARYPEDYIPATDTGEDAVDEAESDTNTTIP